MTERDTQVEERHSAAESASTLVNLRDLGGMPTQDGTITRHGVLYRSDAPYPNDSDPVTVDQWPPAAVLDLRSQRERDDVGHEWTEGSRPDDGPRYEQAATTCRDGANVA